MKFLHLADLHLGKRIHAVSLLEDQRYLIFQEIIPLIEKESIPLVIIAGDVFDLAIPSEKATELYDEFLTTLTKMGVQAIIIPGNHDSATRVCVANGVYHAHGIHLVSSLKDALRPIVIDGVNFYAVPFCKHYDVNAAFDCESSSYQEAFEFLLSKMEIDESQANVLIAHQCVLPSSGELSRSGSEEAMVGTLQNIPSSTFSIFDYVALGHIHKAQNVGKGMRYPGTCLAYHSDEISTPKTFSIVSVEGKDIAVTEVPVHPLHNARKIKGSFEEVMKGEPSNDYIYFELTDAKYVTNAMDQLHALYPNALHLSYPSYAGEANMEESHLEEQEHKSLEERFADFFFQMTEKEMSDFQKEAVLKAKEGE